MRSHIESQTLESLFFGAPLSNDNAAINFSDL